MSKADRRRAEWKFRRESRFSCRRICIGEARRVSSRWRKFNFSKALVDAYIRDVMNMAFADMPRAVPRGYFKPPSYVSIKVKMER